jgi:hypothetical protein
MVNFVKVQKRQVFELPLRNIFIIPQGRNTWSNSRIDTPGLLRLKIAPDTEE